VAASIIATEISAVTLVSLPSVVFRDGGNLTYLQLGVIGSFVARWLIALYLVPAYYEREIFSPYDYMGQRLGGNVRGVTTSLFALGGVLAQSARVYLIAIVLEVILQGELAWVEDHLGIPSLAAAVGAIGVVAILWTLLGGIATVIWTDAILFLVFLAAIVIALVTVSTGIEGGMGEVLRAGNEAGKLRFLDTSASLAKPYTIYAALFAVSWGNVGAYGTDQLLAQRVLCCSGVRDAQKAILASYGAMVVTVLVGLVGVALFAWYREFPLAGSALALFEEKPDRIFPIFVMQAVPIGLKGLILAGAFAAAISSLDSILAALSQTTLSALYLPWRRRAGADTESPEEQRRALRVSRSMVVVFGIGLSILAVQCAVIQRHYPSILDLALSMAGYTQGALLAGFLLAFLRLRVDGTGFVWAAPLSVLAVFAVAWSSAPEPGASVTSLWSLQVYGVGAGVLLAAWFAGGAGRGSGVLPAGLRSLVLVLAVALLGWINASGFTISWPWYVPVGCTVAFGCGYLLGRRPSGRTEET
jgi:Na+/proline symporter